MSNSTEMDSIDLSDMDTNGSQSGRQGRLLNPQCQKAFKSAYY